MAKPSNATDQNGFAVTKALADRYSVRTLSQFAAKCSGPATILAGPDACGTNAYCRPGLKSTYGIDVGSLAVKDAGGPATKDALRSGAATIGLIFTSDAALA